MIGIYSVAVGDDYAVLALRSFGVTRHFNPSVHISLFCQVKNFELVLRWAKDINVEVHFVEGRETDRWSCNFLKWECDLSKMPNVDYYWYMDADCPLVTPISRTLVEEILQKPLACSLQGVVDPKEKEPWMVKEYDIRDEKWGSPEHAYYVLPECRHSYYSAGCVLATAEGMRHWHLYLAEKKKQDLKNGYWKTSKWFDEQYFNRYILVDHPERVCAFPPKLHAPGRYFIGEPVAVSHMGIHGKAAGMASMHEQLDVLEAILGVHPCREIDKLLGVNNYKGSGWLMSTADRYTHLGILLTLNPKVFVQVGTFKGADLEVVKSRFPDMQVYAIDIDSSPLPPHWADRNWIHFEEGDSKVLLPQLLQKVTPDVIFIDGSHSYELVAADIQACMHYAPKAVIYGHDWHYEDVRRAVADSMKIYLGWELSVIDTPPFQNAQCPSADYGGFFILRRDTGPLKVISNKDNLSP